MAILQAGVTGLSATLKWSGFSTDHYWDVGLALVLAWGFHRMSRVAGRRGGPPPGGEGERECPPIRRQTRRPVPRAGAG
jgi:hypothetical protein